MTDNTHGQVPAIQRYKIGYEAGWKDGYKHGAWSTQQPAPATQQAGEVVAYLDIGAGGYLDLGSALSDEDLQQLPKGRHALVIAGTYGIDGYVATPQPSPAAQAADSVTAPAGPSKSLPYEPTSAMLIAARERDPALPIETVRAIYWSMWRTAPTPPAPAADSVLEDAARWQWLADYLIGERTDLDEGIVACATIDALRKFADAARKQGGTQ